MGVGGYGIEMRSGNWGRGIDRLFFEFWGLDLGLWDGAWIDWFPNYGGLNLGYCGTVL